uniref:Sas10 domain-containing protein n=1 Tax=Elaeophora elaphi TaxID=1147741 RepID=A0A0R3RX52_9BILA
MDSEEDSNEIYDEIDRHHMSLDMPDNEEADPVIRRQVEVLNVEGDSSSSDDDDDYNKEERNSFSDSDEDDLNNVENYLAHSLKHFRPGLMLERQLLLAVNVFARYLTNLLFAIHVKIAGSSCHQAPQFIDHPVLQALSTLQKEMFVILRFLEKHSAILRRIRNNIESKNFGNMLDTLPTVEFVLKSRMSKGNKESEQLLIEKDGRSKEVQVVSDEMGEGIIKRSITNQIEKNKGLQNKRKKGTQHSRVKKRKQFKKALIKKHSQKADARKELTPYGGETRGIRASTVRSVKLKA